jgi:hypothetical protein
MTKNSSLLGLGFVILVVVGYLTGVFGKTRNRPHPPKMYPRLLRPLCRGRGITHHRLADRAPAPGQALRDKHLRHQYLRPDRAR